MFLNLFKITWRGYLRNRAFTVINLASLTVGLFVAFVAIGYIRYELSFDTFHKNADSIYRLGRTYRSQDYGVVGFAKWNDTSGEEQRQQIESLKKVTGIKNTLQFITSVAPEFAESGNQKIEVDQILTTNTPQAFCEVFSWTVRQGSLNNFYSGYDKIILTASTAQKLFGETALSNPNLIQQQVRVAGQVYSLVAIIDDVPLHSHVDFNLVLSQPRLDYWGSRIYVQLDENVDKLAAEKEINATIPHLYPALSQDALYQSHFLQPIKDIHLKSNILYELKPPGNQNYLLLIGCFALFIVVLTLFNYANLSLALKSKQSKGIGVRKALGAMHSAIAGQFVFEGILLAFFALPLVAFSIHLLIPYFNSLMGVNLPSNIFPTRSRCLYWLF